MVGIIAVFVLGSPVLLSMGFRRGVPFSPSLLGLGGMLKIRSVLLMALDDVAHLISPHRPAIARRILMCFYKNNGRSLADLLKETGLKEKTLRYYLTRMRFYRLIEYDRDQRLYYLTLTAFHARIDTLLIDPISALVGGRHGSV
jgi:hypothetical protein